MIVISNAVVDKYSLVQLQFLGHIHVVHYTSRTLTDLGLVAGHRFDWELHLCGFENSVLLQDILLGLVMTKRLKHRNRCTSTVLITWQVSHSGRHWKGLNHFF